MSVDFSFISPFTYEPFSATQGLKVYTCSNSSKYYPPYVWKLTPQQTYKDMITYIKYSGFKLIAASYFSGTYRGVKDIYRETPDVYINCEYSTPSGIHRRIQEFSTPHISDAAPQTVYGRHRYTIKTVLI